MRARILLADDNESILKRARRLLEQDFDILATVRDGKSLISRALELRPDVMVVDVAMPECDGITAIRAIKRRYPEGKVIFLTMHQDPGLLQDAFAAGAVGYVLKACASTDLIVAVREALAGRHYVSPRVTAV